MRQRLHDVSILIARLAIGFIFVAHGYQKLVLNGLEATIEGFDTMGVPFPELTAGLTAGIELVAGSALILGVALQLAGVLLAAVMTGALVITHWPQFWVGEGGLEFVLALATASLMIGFSGGGALALDKGLAKILGRRQASDEKTESESAEAKESESVTTS